MNQKKLVGITGGIGAGKSIICSIIHAMGYPVFYSDIEAKKLLNTDPILREEIVSIFGSEAYTDAGLNRAYIAKRIFNDQILLNQMNALVHPAVRKAFDQWAEQQEQEVVFNEAAILFETGAYQLYDSVVLVTAPEEIRIERVKKRDGVSTEQVKERMLKQWPDEKKARLADHVLINDNSSMLIPQVMTLLDNLKQ